MLHGAGLHFPPVWGAVAASTVVAQGSHGASPNNSTFYWGLDCQALCNSREHPSTLHFLYFPGTHTCTKFPQTHRNHPEQNSYLEKQKLLEVYVWQQKSRWSGLQFQPWKQRHGLFFLNKLTDIDLAERLSWMESLRNKWARNLN